MGEVKCIRHLSGEVTTLNECETDTEMDLKERRLQSVNLINQFWIRTSGGLCEHGTERLACIKCGVFLD